MRIGRIISLPNEYSQYGRILDRSGSAYTIEKGEIPKGAEVDDEYAYKVELYGNDSGLAYALKEE